jgi:hypothetical protein
MELNDAEKIVACKWIWKSLETKQCLDIYPRTLRLLAIESELVDAEINIPKITEYLHNKISEPNVKWAFQKPDGLKVLPEKQELLKL